MTYGLWLGRDTVIFVIRFYLSRLTRNDLRMLADFFSILLETQETVVYNATASEAFVSPVERRSSGGLAQLGEHYVRNVGVGGSTPLPSTTLTLTRRQPQ